MSQSQQPNHLDSEFEAAGSDSDQDGIGITSTATPRPQYECDIGLPRKGLPTKTVQKLYGLIQSGVVTSNKQK